MTDDGVRFDFHALDFFATVQRARDTFLLNYGQDFRRFESLANLLHGCWKEFGRTRDAQGRSHAGLLVLAQVLQRHAVLGFQALVSYQSFLTWLTFRPGLEAFLFIGKWVDDPRTASIWSDRATDRKTYRAVFEGDGLRSKSIREFGAFRSVLTRVSDAFLHPNPWFAYRDQSRGPGYVSMQYLETEPVLHEAHLLAFLNLLDRLYVASCELRQQVLGQPFVAEGVRVADAEGGRARAIAATDAEAKAILEDLGLWRFGDGASAGTPAEP